MTVQALHHNLQTSGYSAAWVTRSEFLPRLCFNARAEFGTNQSSYGIFFHLQNHTKLYIPLLRCSDKIQIQTVMTCATQTPLHSSLALGGEKTKIFDCTSALENQFHYLKRVPLSGKHFTRFMSRNHALFFPFLIYYFHKLWKKTKLCENGAI